YGPPYGAYGYGNYGGYGYPYYYPPQTPKKPGETYAKVISWIVTIVGGIGVLGGIIVLLIALFAVTNGEGDNLAFIGSIAGFTVGPLLGGALGVYYGITGILRRKAPRFTLPPWWALAALTALALAASVVILHIDLLTGDGTGGAFGVFPLAALCGILPAFTILAFTSQRLGQPSTRRRVWMSLFYGMTLAPLAAVILELIFTVIIAAVLGVNAGAVSSLNTVPQTGTQILAIILIVSVVAPLVEESVKPLGAVLAMRRLRTPAEAFLVGMAGGIGFDMFETLGYIGQGQADWIYVAIERIGAGLLHGVGAGMVGLGWYYFINGKGVRLRWLRGIGCGVYAVLQHGLFNGSNAITFFPLPFNQQLQQPLYLGQLPFEAEFLIFIGFYILMAAVLVFITGRLKNAPGMPTPTATPTNTPAAPVYPPYPYPYPSPYPYPYPYPAQPTAAPALPTVSHSAGGNY
ncbi:MAG: PrsW family glutamic-type intramembrane protease, partial [Ktedonobacterales bacterium]